MDLLRLHLDPDPAGSSGGGAPAPQEPAPQEPQSQPGPQPAAGSEPSTGGGEPQFQFSGFELVDGDSSVQIKSPEDLFKFIGSQTESSLAPIQQELEKLKFEHSQALGLLEQYKNFHPQNVQPADPTSAFDMPDYDPLDPESTKKAFSQMFKALEQRMSGNVGNVDKAIESRLEQYAREQQVARDKQLLVASVKQAIPSIGMNDEQILSFARNALSNPETIGQALAAIIKQGTKSSGRFSVRPLSQNGQGNDAKPAASNLGTGTPPNELSEAKKEFDKINTEPWYAQSLRSSNKAKWDRIHDLAVENGWK